MINKLLKEFVMFINNMASLGYFAVGLLDNPHVLVSLCFIALYYYDYTRETVPKKKYDEDVGQLFDEIAALKNDLEVITFKPNMS